ncbi:MAG TPA: hypothetical protein VKO20_00020, partial [Desulfosalsimonadaceae bacterium]|nr:hypothetical protein [Desulfosalsimonadaceae bacterium]
MVSILLTSREKIKYFRIGYLGKAEKACKLHFDSTARIAKRKGDALVKSGLFRWHGTFAESNGKLWSKAMLYFIRPYPVFTPRPVAPCAISKGLLRQLTVNSPFRAQTTARFGCAWPRAINKARQWPLGQTPGMTKIK